MKEYIVKIRIKETELQSFPTISVVLDVVGDMLAERGSIPTKIEGVWLV